MILMQYEGFSSAAGYIGPKYHVDHNISLLVPELWCHMTPKERNPEYMINEYSLVVTTFIGADPIHDAYNLVERDIHILTDVVAFIGRPPVHPCPEITKLKAINKIIFFLLLFFFLSLLNIFYIGSRFSY
jgi:hypothetical protein